MTLREQRWRALWHLGEGCDTVRKTGGRIWHRLAGDATNADPYAVTSCGHKFGLREYIPWTTQFPPLKGRWKLCKRCFP